MEANPDRPGAHKASWGTRGSFPLRHSGRSVGLTTHIYLMSRLIMSGDTEYIHSRTRLHDVHDESTCTFYN